MTVQAGYTARWAGGVFGSLLMVVSATADGTQSSDAPLDAYRCAAEIDRLLSVELGTPADDSVRRVSDAAYLRRVTLDLIGDLPTPDEIAAFQLDASADKRQRVVQHLLENPQFGQHWARYWRDVILYRRLEDRAMVVAKPLEDYLAQAINDGTPWEDVVREFITATGDVREVGTTSIYVAQEGRTEETTAEIARIFLGIQIQCAQCHDHVTDRWTRQQFHELAAFLPRVVLRPMKTETERTFVLMGVDRGPRRPRAENRRRANLEHYMPDLENPGAPGTPMTPKFFLTDQTLPLGTPDETRRATLADWLTQSPWFAKAYVNRIWSELMGTAFYEAVDDLGPDRSSQAPRTLEYVAENFAAGGFDVKWLLRTLTATEAYSREAGGSEGLRPAVAVPRWKRLRADPLFTSLLTALDISEDALPVRPARQPMKAVNGAMRGPRARFEQIFGYDPSDTRDEVTGSIPQALALMNGPLIQRQIDASSRRTLLGRLLCDEAENRAVVEELYLRCLARRPEAWELEECLRYTADVGDRQAAFEDMLWALINSAEFQYRH